MLTVNIQEELGLMCGVDIIRKGMSHICLKLIVLILGGGTMIKKRCTEIEENPQFQKAQKLRDIGYLLISFIPLACFFIVWIIEGYMGYGVDRMTFGIILTDILLIGCYLLYKSKRLLEDLEPLMSDYEKYLFFDDD